MNTNTTSSGSTPRFSLAQMSDIMMSRSRPAFGFFLSQALWSAMQARVNQETGGEVWLGRDPQTLHGLRIAVDPSLPETEFDVAFTEKAWVDRLKQLSDTHQPEPT